MILEGNFKVKVWFSDYALTGCILHANFLTNCAGIVVVDANELKKLILIPSLTLWSIMRAIELPFLKSDKAFLKPLTPFSIWFLQI